MKVSLIWWKQLAGRQAVCLILAFVGSLLLMNNLLCFRRRPRCQLTRWKCCLIWQNIKRVGICGCRAFLKSAVRPNTRREEQQQQQLHIDPLCDFCSSLPMCHWWSHTLKEVLCQGQAGRNRRPESRMSFSERKFWNDLKNQSSGSTLKDLRCENHDAEESQDSGSSTFRRPSECDLHIQSCAYLLTRSRCVFFFLGNEGVSQLVTWSNPADPSAAPNHKVT